MHHGLQRVLDEIAASAPDCDPHCLADLAEAMRPRDATDGATALGNLRSLTLLLTERRDYADALRGYLLHLIATRRPVHLFANTGTPTQEGFGRELLQKLAYRVLPPALDLGSFEDILSLAFRESDDWRWLGSLLLDACEDLLAALGPGGPDDAEHQTSITLAILEAIQVLSYRVAAIGLDPEFVRNEPALEEHESPFVGQQIEARRYIVDYRKWLVDRARSLDDDRHLDVLLDQCENTLERIRSTAQRYGTSVRLTYFWLIQREYLERMRTLLRLVDPVPAEDFGHRVVSFALDLVGRNQRKHSLRDFVGRNTRLLALRVTENAGKTGEHYVANDRLEYRAMLASAMGAGLIVAVMALFKIGILTLHLPPLIETMSVCMNYACGFMLIHVLHFTLATKQPAMTANLIARTLSAAPDSRRALDDLAELALKVARTQMIAIVGNVVLAFPVAWLIAGSIRWASGKAIASPEKAVTLLHDLDPVASPALFYAAIAGVWLFASGLISGYYDNAAVYNRIPQRIRQLRLPARMLGQARLDRFALYAEQNLGALAGNFFFGVLLGMTSFIGFLTGLPLDIRHVTFAAANFAYGLAGLDHGVPWSTIAWCVAGIAGIGVLNLAVSFSLAIYVAMRSRRATWRNWGELIRRLLRLLRERPGEFFLPPRDA
ncbi:MAG TPA: site-specific recombinase [Burkholderiales bacterium]|nr:site-specific recombinase [Burkholderiales bacterium]